MKMGLQERVSSDTWRNTPSGTELNIDLFEVFMGIWDVGEVPSILEDHRLIDEWECDSIYARMSRKANPESVLVGYVRRAYLIIVGPPTFYTRHKYNLSVLNRMKSTMETEHIIPQRNFRRSLLAIAELIKAIVEEMSEEEIQQSASQQQFTNELSATDL
jgi:hypothetical protein